MMKVQMLELYRQAQVPHTAIDPSNNMPYQTTCFSAEKFAELLVEKCAAICLITAENFAPFFSRESDGARVCYEKIKEHFGVK